MRHHRFLLMVFLSFASGTCFAHTGLHPLEGFAAGFIHPFAGPDHVLAMLGVGLWAALLPGAGWRLPAAFMGLMAVGGVLGTAGMTWEGIEAGIAASVLAFGLLVACRARFALPFALALTGVFALFHGLAHGAEMAEGTGYAVYALGFVLATGLLHLNGILLGRFLLRAPALFRILGGFAAVWGAFLLAQSA